MNAKKQKKTELYFEKTELFFEKTSILEFQNKKYMPLKIFEFHEQWVIDTFWIKSTQFAKKMD